MTYALPPSGPATLVVTSLLFGLYFVLFVVSLVVMFRRPAPRMVVMKVIGPLLFLVLLVNFGARLVQAVRQPSNMDFLGTEPQFDASTTRMKALRVLVRRWFGMNYVAQMTTVTAAVLFEGILCWRMFTHTNNSWLCLLLPFIPILLNAFEGGFLASKFWGHFTCKDCWPHHAATAQPLIFWVWLAVVIHLAISGFLFVRIMTMRRQNAMTPDGRPRAGSFVGALVESAILVWVMLLLWAVFWVAFLPNHNKHAGLGNMMAWITPLTFGIWQCIMAIHLNKVNAEAEVFKSVKLEEGFD